MVKKVPKKQRNKFIQFSGIGIQMTITIIVGVFIGNYLDCKFPNDSSIYTLIFSLLFVCLSLYLVIKKAIKFGENEQ